MLTIDDIFVLFYAWPLNYLRVYFVFIFLIMKWMLIFQPLETFSIDSECTEEPKMFVMN